MEIGTINTDALTERKPTNNLLTDRREGMLRTDDLGSDRSLEVMNSVDKDAVGFLKPERTRPETALSIMETDARRNPPPPLTPTPKADKKTDKTDDLEPENILLVVALKNAEKELDLVPLNNRPATTCTAIRRVNGLATPTVLPATREVPKSN